MSVKREKKEAAATQEELAGSLGALLIEYRESAGYSVTQTADALCLAENTIIRLENEQFETLAEPPYIRGYLRGYAKIAEKSPDELIGIYETLRGAAPDELQHRFKPASSFHRKRSFFPLLVRLAIAGLVIAVLLAVFMTPGVQNWFSKTWSGFSQQGAPHPGDSQNNPELLGNMPAPLPMTDGADADSQHATDHKVNANKTNSDNNDENKKPLDKTLAQLANIDFPIEDKARDKINDKATANEATANKAATNNEGKNKKPGDNLNPVSAGNNKSEANNTTQKDKQQEKQADSGANASNNKVNIKLKFNKEVWLRIRDKNNKTVYEGQTPAGNEKILELEKPLKFRVGNAQGVSIFVDGKPKDISPYIKGSIANFTIQ